MNNITITNIDINESLNNTVTNISNSSSNQTLFKIKETIIQNVSENITKLAKPELISTIDPNWFYSTVAQSSAAIVGILGAFLTTKIIIQKQEINSLESEISTNDKKIKFLLNKIIKKRDGSRKLMKKKIYEMLRIF